MECGCWKIHIKKRERKNDWNKNLAQLMTAEHLLFYTIEFLKKRACCSIHVVICNFYLLIKDGLVFSAKLMYSKLCLSAILFPTQLWNLLYVTSHEKFVKTKRCNIILLFYRLLSNKHTLLSLNIIERWNIKVMKIHIQYWDQKIYIYWFSITKSESDIWRYVEENHSGALNGICFLRASQKVNLNGRLMKLFLHHFYWKNTIWMY